MISFTLPEEQALTEKIEKAIPVGEYPKEDIHHEQDIERSGKELERSGKRK